MVTGQRAAVLGLTGVRDAQGDAAVRIAAYRADALGERLLVFDDAGPPKWDALRLRAEFASAPACWRPSIAGPSNSPASNTRRFRP